MTLAFCVLLIGHGVPTAPAAAPADTVLVCAPGLLEAMSPWIKYRESQGHHLVVISEYENAEDIRAQIRSQAALGPLRFALLVGDVSEDPLAAYHLPTHFEEARINSAWGAEQQIATDNWFADLDDDDLPDLAIGRNIFVLWVIHSLVRFVASCNVNNIFCFSVHRSDRPTMIFF